MQYYSWSICSIVCVPNQVKQTNLKLFNLMLGTNETNVNVNADWMKIYIIQSKNGIMMNVGASVKN